MVNDKQLKLSVLASLRDLGLRADLVDEVRDIKTPDLRIAMEDEITLVEVKERYEPEGRAKVRQQAFNDGVQTFLEQPRELRPSAGVDAKLERASDQLKYESELNPFRIVWYEARGSDSAFCREEILATLTGRQRLSDGAAWEWCYYFYDSAFFRYRFSIDGAVVGHEGEAQLWLNDFSTQYLKCSSRDPI